MCTSCAFPSHLVEAAANVRFAGDRAAAALVILCLGLLDGAVAMARLPCGGQAARQHAASRASWADFSEEAFQGGSAEAHRWARSGATVLLGEHAAGGGHIFEPASMLAHIRTKWRSVGKATGEPNGAAVFARHRPFTVLACPTWDRIAEVAAMFSKRTSLPRGFLLERPRRCWGKPSAGTSSP